MVSIHEFGDFREWSDEDKKYYLIDHVENVCIDDETAAGHVNALFFSLIGATCVEFPEEVRMIFDKLFTSIEDGNYDTALEMAKKDKAINDYMRHFGYDIDNHAEAGD